MYVIRQIDHTTGKRRILSFTFTDYDKAERFAVRLTFAGPRAMSYVVRYVVDNRYLVWA